MGGQNSENYRLFLGYAFQAYHILRRNAALLITLLEMMMDANIKDCKPEYLKKKIGLAASAHTRYDLDHTVMSQGNKFIQIFIPFYMCHANRILCQFMTGFSTTKITVFIRTAKS